MKIQITDKSIGDTYYSESDTDSEIEFIESYDESFFYENHFSDPTFEDQYSDTSDDTEDDDENYDQQRKGVFLILTPFGNVSEQIKHFVSEEDLKNTYKENSGPQLTNNESVVNYWGRVRNRRPLRANDRHTNEELAQSKTTNSELWRLRALKWTAPEELKQFEEYYKTLYRNERSGSSESGLSISTQTSNIRLSDENMINASQQISAPNNTPDNTFVAIDNNGLLSRSQLNRRPMATRGRQSNRSMAFCRPHSQISLDQMESDGNH